MNEIEKRQFVLDILNEVYKRYQEKEQKIPMDWNGRELKEYIKYIFDEILYFDRYKVREHVIKTIKTNNL
jgi:hypothetical protein